ncbi:TPA: outer membrane protein [Legionella pneumophila]
MNHFMKKTAIAAMSLIFISEMSYAKGSFPAAVATKRSTTDVTKKWTGLYGGLNIGGIFNDAELDANHLGFVSPNGTCDKDSDFSSVFPGLQLGYAHQFDSRVVLGIEGDFTYNIKKTGRSVCVCDPDVSVADQFTIKNRLQGSLRGRIGYTLENHLLPYMMAGESLAHLGINYRNEGGDYYSKNSTRAGWLVGGGLEWAISQTWSIRAEYFYTDYGNAMNMKIPSVYGLMDPNGHAEYNLNANNIRLAINYWV